MHIPDGLLSPAVCVATGAISLGAVGFSLRRLKQSLADRVVPLTGMMAAIIFAGQMVNFPVAGTMMSGHLMGGVLAAVVLGPWAGCLALTMVLVVQCIVFSDGGLMSLGANVLHMGVVGSLGGYVVYSAVCRRFRHSRRGIVIATVVASWVSVMAAACLFCVEFQLSGHGSEYDLSTILTLMIAFHSAIGIGEAVVSGVAIGFIQQQRPDFIHGSQAATAEGGFGGRTIMAGVVVALAIAAFVAPFASERPDGLEAVAERTQMDRLESAASVFILADYEVPAPFDGWDRAAGWQRTAVAIAGIGGTLSVVVLAAVFGRAMRVEPVAEAPRD